MEQITYNIMFRWFVGLSMDVPVWGVTVFTKNRDRLAEMRDLGATPHVAQNTTNRRSAIDGRTARHPGYAISQQIRKRVEEVFGWIKQSAGFRKTRHRGTARSGLDVRAERRSLQPGASAEAAGPGGVVGRHPDSVRTAEFR